MRRVLAAVVAIGVVGSIIVGAGGAPGAGAETLTGEALSVRATAGVPYDGLVARLHDDVPGAVRDHQAVVEAYYVDILGRVGSAADVTPTHHWVSLLDRRLPRPSLVGALLGSGEGRRHLVGDIYAEYLGRSPSPSEAGYWADVLASGPSIFGARAAILGSNELYRQAGSTDVGWVEAVYERVLGRPAGEEARGTWAAEVARRGRAAVAADILNSSEGRHVLVAAHFVDLLGRAPSDGARAFWAGVLASSGELSVIAAIGGADEYVVNLPSDYSVEITWEPDGATTVGALRRASDGWLEVRGRHVYAGVGARQVEVEVTSAEGEVLTVATEVDVVEPRSDRFVHGLFADLLGRPPSSGSVRYWASNLTTGGPQARESVAVAIGDSLEARRRRVGAMFEAYLERAPSSGAADYWAGVVSQSSLEHVRALLLASGEVYERAGGSDARWVDEIHALVLGRSPSAEEREAALDRMGHVGRAGVANEVLTNEEARRRLAAQLIAELLDRPASEAEAAAWAERLLSGTLDERRLIGELAGSNEYFARFPLALPPS